MAETDPREQELIRGIWIELLDEGSILAVRIATIERAALDYFYHWIEVRLDGWDERQPWLALYDLTTRGAMLTPYMRRQITAFAMLRPDVGGRVAFVMRRDTTMSLFHLSQVNTATRARVMRIWQDRRQALAWLRELL